MSQSVLILCPDTISQRMAGPAIRYWEFAKALSCEHLVTLAAPNHEAINLTPPHQNVTLSHHNHDTIQALEESHDIIIFQGFILDIYPFLQHSTKILIADLYDPIPLEGLELGKNNPNHDEITNQVRVINTQLKYADYFLCASERQRDLWLGHLMSLGRINHHSYATLQQRIISVPFGLPDHPATPVENVDTGFFAKEENEAKKPFILLWGGGIWEWFDPLTIIHAVHRLSQKYPEIKLIFLGTKHPNPGIDVMPMQHQAEKLAKELKIYGKQVIFQVGWVPYEHLPNYLLAANVGVSAHFNTLETHYSFRTRILHYLWAEKPIITTRGDILAEQIEKHQAGIVVDYKDIDGWMAAIEKLYNPVYHAKYIAGIKKLAKTYTWSKVTRQLTEICHHATIAQDIENENNSRKSLIWDCEREYNVLKHQLDTIERSHSWQITAPMRAFRRWLSR